MKPDSADPTVFVETSARLHFGLLDLGGALGRWFGGIGTAAPGADAARLGASRRDARGRRGRRRAALRNSPAGSWRAAERVRQNAVRGARICVHRSLPPHAGLGSGTQLALAVGRALAELHGSDHRARPSLRERSDARAGRRSARGRSPAAAWWSRAVDRETRRLRRARCSRGCPFPPAWHCVVAVPDSAAGMNGGAEEAAFATASTAARRPTPNASPILSLMALLPALAEADLANVRLRADGDPGDQRTAGSPPSRAARSRRARARNSCAA